MSDTPRRDFEANYLSGDAPWDIGRPQAEIAALAEAGLITGSALDIGCGTGENALYLAGRGHAVLGLDGSATGIERARQKAVVPRTSIARSGPACHSATQRSAGPWAVLRRGPCT